MAIIFFLTVPFCKGEPGLPGEDGIQGRDGPKVGSFFLADVKQSLI